MVSSCTVGPFATAILCSSRMSILYLLIRISDTQTNSLEDYVESTVMLQYNKRKSTFMKNFWRIMVNKWRKQLLYITKKTMEK